MPRFDQVLSTCVLILGASAGGNLAAAISLKLRDVKHPLRPSLQILFVPCLQAFDFNTPSYQTNTDSGILPRYWMVNYWLWYAHGPHGHVRSYEYIENQHTSPSAKISSLAKRVDHNLVSRKYIDASYVPNAVNFGNESLWKEIEGTFVNPYFAPLMASDLTGQPDTYMATAGWDVLRDDGLMYAKRLADSGVEVESRHYANGLHALYMRFDHFNLSKQVLSDLVQYLSARLWDYLFLLKMCLFSPNIGFDTNVHYLIANPCFWCTFNCRLCSERLIMSWNMGLCRKSFKKVTYIGPPPPVVTICGCHIPMLLLLRGLKQKTL